MSAAILSLCKRLQATTTSSADISASFLRHTTYNWSTVIYVFNDSAKFTFISCFFNTGQNTTNSKVALAMFWLLVFKNIADFCGLAVLGVGLRPIACGNSWFESSWGHGSVFFRQKSLRRDDHSSRGVVSSVVCRTECDIETLTRKMSRPQRVVESWKQITNIFILA